jgi:hypothetical protein
VVDAVTAVGVRNGGIQGRRIFRLLDVGPHPLETFIASERQRGLLYLQ